MSGAKVESRAAQEEVVAALVHVYARAMLQIKISTARAQYIRYTT